ncbi:hypothetical protein LO762_00595 [Actinocorallia sp. API 0066]|uniref:hypothetical protein n=1 Tax=Actinocorallia sp. API 0066 TaxID=2896846 RepID=UPI001E36ED72|nr:hypothetical protein [Actinocorallia sp. API 0066]MCD0447700.1 hypothetical protein [Actinocorallia sp. API 0066]
MADETTPATPVTSASTSPSAPVPAAPAPATAPVADAPKRPAKAKRRKSVPSIFPMPGKAQPEAADGVDGTA